MVGVGCLAVQVPVLVSPRHFECEPAHDESLGQESSESLAVRNYIRTNSGSTPTPASRDLVVYLYGNKDFVFADRYRAAPGSEDRINK
jgi:hypothetical protein